MGGSTWNVARVMARLGVPSAFAGAVSRDVSAMRWPPPPTWRAWTCASCSAMRSRRCWPSCMNCIRPRITSSATTAPTCISTRRACRPAGCRARNGCIWRHQPGARTAGGKLVALAQETEGGWRENQLRPEFPHHDGERYDATLRSMTELADVIKVSDEDLAGLFRHGDIDGAFAMLRSWNPHATYFVYARRARCGAVPGRADMAGAPPVIEWSTRWGRATPASAACCTA